MIRYNAHLDLVIVPVWFASPSSHNS